MCDKEILLIIYDKESKNLIEYQSNPIFDLAKFVDIKYRKDDDIADQKKDSIVKNYTFYTNKDYETMTMRHLPPDHWQESLDKINENSREATEKLG